MTTNHLFLSDRIYRVTLFTAGAVVVTAGILFAKTFVIILLLAFFVSIIVAHPVFWLDKKGVPHFISVILVLLGLLIFIFGVGGVIGGSFSQFTSDVGKYESRLIEILNSIKQEFEHLGFNVDTKGITDLLAPGKIIALATKLIGQFGSIMSNATLIFFIILFVLLEIQSIEIKWKVFGTAADNRTRKNLSLIEKSVRHYLVFKTITSFATGVLVFIVLIIIGVDYAVLWGMLAFLLNYIPNIGSIIAAIPALIFAWIQLGFLPMIWVGIGYISINSFIGYFVEPKVMGRGMGLSTLVVFLSLIIWGYMLGVVGMFLSVPLTMTLKIILEFNDSTKPLAAILGTEEDVKKLIKKMN